MAGLLHLSVNKTATIIVKAFIAHVFNGYSNPSFDLTVTVGLENGAFEGHHIL